MALARTLLLTGSTALLLCSQTMQRLPYPPAPKPDQTDDYHGTKIADPYRTLENADSAATQKWVEQENQLTASWLAKQPGREKLRAHLNDLWNFERFADFHKAGPHYYYFRNSGLQNQSILYVTDSVSATAQPRVLIDPNTYRADGTAALNGESISWNGKLMAYAVAQAGSDWNEWRVRDVATGKDLPDLVRWSKDTGVSWAPDDSGFYYGRFPEPPPEKLLTASSINQKIYFHKLGDAWQADKVFYERPDHADWLSGPAVMEGSKALVIVIESGVPGVNMLAWRDLANPSSGTKDLITSAEHEYSPIALIGTLLYLQTNDGAPRGRVIAMDLHQPDRAHWKEIVPEREETLEGAQMASGRILLSYMKDAHSTARLVTVEGKPVADVEMPGLGTAVWSAARLHDQEAFYNFTGYTIPPGIYRLDLQTGKSTPIRQGKVAFDAGGL